MDALMFLKEKERICGLYKGCSKCPLSCNNNKYGDLCEDFQKRHPEEAVKIVEKWSAEHPIKIRKSECLKMFPDAEIIKNGALQICPMNVEKSKKFNCCINCDDCKKEYWLSEME